MKKNQKKLDAENLRYLKILGIVLISIVFYAIINNLGKVGGVISSFIDVIIPIILGLCIAFVLNIPLRFFENTVFKRLTNKNGKFWSKAKRPICLLLSIISVLTVLTLLLYFIIPEFIRTCARFFFELPSYMVEFTAILRNLAEKFNLPIDSSTINIDWEWVSAKALQLFNSNGTDLSQSAISILVSVFNGFFNAILGFVFSIYILSAKEALGKLSKSLLYATLSRKKARSVIDVAVLSGKAFSGFVSGQCIEVALIGVLCFIGMLILRMPYALMVSCIIAVTAFVPVFGAIIGAVVGALLILIVDPIKAIWFLIFILVLQQVESNVVYPKIMGKQVGLPGIWVLVAVTIGGGLFSVVGIIVSVPLCSVFYTLFQKWLIQRLEKRNICHRSMSHDTSEPKMMVEGLENFEFDPTTDTSAPQNSENTEKTSQDENTPIEETV